MKKKKEKVPFEEFVLKVVFAIESKYAEICSVS